MFINDDVWSVSGMLSFCVDWNVPKDCNSLIFYKGVWFVFIPVFPSWYIIVQADVLEYTLICGKDGISCNEMVDRLIIGGIIVVIISLLCIITNICCDISINVKNW